jgi:hypothetical protein
MSNSDSLFYLVNINSRRKYANKIREYFTTENNNIKIFIKKNYKNGIVLLYTLKKKIDSFISGHLGEVGGSVDAEAYFININRNNNQYKAALKIIPLTYQEANNIKNIKYKSWKELHLLTCCYNIVQNYNTQNLPVIILYFICKNCTKDDYMNPNIKKYYNNLQIRKKLKSSNDSSEQQIYKRMERKKGFGTSSLCIVNELCDDSIKGLISSTQEVEKISQEFFITFIFQIINGIYALSKIYKIIHFDCHGGNILVSKVISGGFWSYMVNNTIYYIPNYGYILKVWDFGRSLIIGKDNYDKIYDAIISQAKRFYKSAFENDKDLEKKMYKYLNKDNIQIICYAFDIWRIISYIYSKLKKEQYLEYKFNEIIKLLNRIKKKTEDNWILPLLSQEPIYNDIDKFTSFLLNKYFKIYTKQQKDSIIINKKHYEL